MRKPETRQTLPAEELALFCEQIGMVLGAGIPLHDGMDTLAETYANTAYAARFNRIRAQLTESGSLTSALEDAGFFPKYLVGMVRIGERAGKLDDVMRALASYYQWEADVKTSVKNAILYPTVLVCMLAVVIAVLLISVLPVFNRVFASLGLSAGVADSGIMRIGVNVGKGTLILVGLMMLALIVLTILLRGKRRDKVIETLGRWIPSVRRANEKLSAGRFASVISTMLVAGYPLASAMELAPEVITDQRYREKIAVCNQLLADGERFADAVAEAKLFDPIHEKMVRFGMEAGQLDAVMEKLCTIYQNEADDAINGLVSMIEPILVAVLSVVFGGVLLSVMLPLLSVLSAIG